MWNRRKGSRPAMRRPALMLMSYNWSSKNRRAFLLAVTVLCALVVFLWRRPDEPSLDTSGAGAGTDGNAEEDQHIEQSGVLRFAPTVPSDNDTYSLRVKHTIQQCQHMLGSNWESLSHMPKFYSSPVISTKYNLMYCPVGKVASSYFTRFFISMHLPGPMQSPYQIPINNAGRGRLESFKNIPKTEERLVFLRKTTKIVFGRNPYSRIFSAYIDKVYSPNPFYWKYWGQKARRLAGANGKTCAHDLSFQEFVHYVVGHLYKNDVHLRPVHDECRMCENVYDFIGKLETTTDDIDHLASMLNISSAFQYASDYSFSAMRDSVLDSVQSAFSWRRDIQTCMTLDEMGARIWRKFQIRGFIQASIVYPFRPRELAQMKEERFVSACLEAIKASTDKAELKKQKNQAFKEAYKSISPQDLQNIGQAYMMDFLLFDYDREPPSLFQDMEHVKDTNYLDWRNKWSL